MSNIVGYTTVNQTNASLRLKDLELAKRDLLNHFHIRKGEKWTNPDFGSNLPYYVFQPLDDTTIEMIREEVYNVVTHDPRFELSVDNSVTVSKKDQTVTVAVELLYLPSTTATDLQIIFDTDFTEMAEF
jgi:phage baseplate assembly protein W|tara:strand:- start:18821 stop:19207 length:387 start_codon:yes stop_codon:yes gene_type:complete